MSSSSSGNCSPPLALGGAGDDVGGASTAAASASELATFLNGPVLKWVINIDIHISRNIALSFGIECVCFISLAPDPSRGPPFGPGLLRPCNKLLPT